MGANGNVRISSQPLLTKRLQHESLNDVLKPNTTENECVFDAVCKFEDFVDKHFRRTSSNINNRIY